MLLYCDRPTFNTASVSRSLVFRFPIRCPRGSGLMLRVVRNVRELGSPGGSCVPLFLIRMNGVGHPRSTSQKLRFATASASCDPETQNESTSPCHSKQIALGCARNTWLTLQNGRKTRWVEVLKSMDFFRSCYRTILVSYSYDKSVAI